MHVGHSTCMYAAVLCECVCRGVRRIAVSIAHLELSVRVSFFRICPRSLRAMSKENKRPRNGDEVQRTNVVKLNVGGKEFHTTAPTLILNSNYFRSLFEFGPHKVDERGCIFVDRCPKLFSILLHAFRTFSRPAQGAINLHKQDLLDECRFYGAEWLRSNIEGKISSLDMRASDRLDEDAPVELLDMFGCCCIEGRCANELQIPLLLGGQTNRLSAKCTNIEAFAARLDNFSRGILSMLAKDPDCRGIVVAGGSALAALAGSTGATDIDIFLVSDPTQAEQKLRAVYEACRRVCRERSHPTESGYRKTMLVTRTTSTVTILTSSAAPPVQVILHIYTSISEILTRFDVDCCCLAFDLANRKLLATPRCLRALVHILA